jgi:hypothetical protein
VAKEKTKQKQKQTNKQAKKKRKGKLPIFLPYYCYRMLLSEFIALFLSHRFFVFVPVKDLKGVHFFTCIKLRSLGKVP